MLLFLLFGFALCFAGKRFLCVLIVRLFVCVLSWLLVDGVACGWAARLLALPAWHTRTHTCVVLYMCAGSMAGAGGDLSL